IYLEEAESLYENLIPVSNTDYINLINSLAVTYGNMGLSDKEEEYFSKGIKLAASENSFLAFNMMNSYGLALGNSGNVKRGEELLATLVQRARDIYGTDSRYYIEILENYADFILRFEKDVRKSIALYENCIDYLNDHDDDNLRDPVLRGYARALYADGQSGKALETLQDLLFYGIPYDYKEDPYRNPPSDSISANGATLEILRLKYDILWNIFSSSGRHEILEAAANTSDLIIYVIDKIRINISEEESRIVLGNRYRDSYLMAIRDFELCYRKTGKRIYLEKAFEFAEKSKVAGLLAATRELNAIQMNIPTSAAENEKSLQREIGFYNSRIAAENEKSIPDKTLLANWNQKLLDAVTARDSLVLTFKKEYPGYFTMKYNTKTPEMNEIPALLGRKYNYLSYIVSDSLLYIFVVNRKYQELLSFRTDSLFIEKLTGFRSMLSSSEQSQNARSGFEKYINTGYELYKTLIEPVRKYLISDELLISPDNILSYLPFETILTSAYSGNEILYRKLDYLLNRYNISYTYSATFMEEIVNRDYKRLYKLVAFAPVYTKALNIDSLLYIPRTRQRVLHDLPYARQEAQYVSEISGGKLYLNKEARESVFKSVAGEYDIIHLAMHTVLNDVNPMNSAMIFIQEGDSPEDGLLYTYEVYGIPMKARLVVLSSCNTGSGKLSAGEGILSLARGFLYSGSQSVVMSMWEIEDKSGTDIIRLFYDNLKKGRSKSEALKKARSSYLKNASQLKSHPYYWSSLVVYGNNAPVYFSRKIIITGLCILIAILSGAFLYLRYRKYS
ncbi:MAG: CHAT domain-containing protein, partial [Bacteroidales bacterium]|nr:CHAT domain-containing protein [Bacteroidales bacterium]